MRRVFVSLLLLSLTATAFRPGGNPEELSWQRLRDVKFRKKWYPLEELVLLYPHFGPSVKALQGKSVAITGYLIPINLESNTYVLSAFPNSQCFFCGGAGPESVILLKPAKPFRRFNTDERRRFSGTFRLNADNIYELNYILDGATLTD